MISCDGTMTSTLCPSGLRGWTQVPLAQAARVQIPQVSYFCRWYCQRDHKIHIEKYLHECIEYIEALARIKPATPALPTGKLILDDTGPESALPHSKLQVMASI